VLRGLGDAGTAQDVVQETFLRAWPAADRFDPELTSLRVWLFAIARYAMLDHFRAAKARPWQGNLIDPSTASWSRRTATVTSAARPSRRCCASPTAMAVVARS